MFSYARSASFTESRLNRASRDCCPGWPGYSPRHPRLRRIAGRPERLLLPVPGEWGEAVREFAGPAADFLFTLTPEEWAEGKFEERRFKEWRSSLPREVRKQCPSSPRVGAVLEHLRKRAEEEGRAAEADPLLSTLRRKLENRGQAGAWAVVADDPLSIIEMGRAAATRRGYSYDSCQCYTPSEFSHHLCHQLPPNLLDPGMAVLVVTERRFAQMARRPIARVILRLVRTYRGSGGKFAWGVLVDRWYGPRVYERAAMEYLFRLCREAGLEVFLPERPYGTPECLAPSGPVLRLRGVRWTNTCVAWEEDDEGEERKFFISPYLDQKAFDWHWLRHKEEKWEMQLRGEGRRAVMKDEA